MELVTIACERDIQDLLLQAHSIDKFIQEPCHHWITVEDESLTPEEWHGILAPYYTRHKLHLTFSKRPDLYFDAPFTVGYRRQQLLKLETAAKVTSDTSLVLDCKNFFIRSTKLSDWPYKNGNGRYTFLDEEPEYFLPKQWVNYIHTVTGLEMPSKFPPRLATPFACTTEYVRAAVEYPKFDGIFYQTSAIPMTEMFYYYFFVPKNQLDSFVIDVGGALGYRDNPNEIDHSIITSPTHGLHRRARKEMTLDAKVSYADWLISLGLNKQLVNDYVYYEMTDISWGM
jgi:hypothetical protein